LLEFVYGVVLWIGKGEIEGTRGLGGEEIPNGDASTAFG